MLSPNLTAATPRLPFATGPPLTQGTPLPPMRWVRGEDGPPLHICGELRWGGKPQAIYPPAPLLSLLRRSREPPLFLGPGPRTFRRFREECLE